MKLMRRQVLQLLASAATLSGSSRIALAQAYPTRPVHLIVGFPAGGTLDILAHMLGQWLLEQKGQTFIVENRPGAASNIAAAAVSHAPADGYTLLLDGSANAINQTSIQISISIFSRISCRSRASPASPT